MTSLTYLVPVLMLAMLVKDAEPIQCWSCSSDSNPLCSDPFQARSDGSNAYLFHLEDCDPNIGASYPYVPTSKAVCKKQKKYIGGYYVIIRGCTWKRRDDYSVGCPSSSNRPDEVDIYCETCDYDGCNGATAIGRTLALLLAPLGLLLFK